MNIKAMIPIVIAVVVALAAWELFIKKFVVKSEFEEGYDYDDEE